MRSCAWRRRRRDRRGVPARRRRPPRHRPEAVRARQSAHRLLLDLRLRPDRPDGQRVGARPQHRRPSRASSASTAAPTARPALPGMPAADMAGSLMAHERHPDGAARREKTGRGDTIDISMQDSLVSWTVNIVSPVFAEGRELDPTTERSLGGNAFYNVYRCADGRSLTLGGSEIKFASQPADRARPARPDRAVQAAAGPRPGSGARVPRRRPSRRAPLAALGSASWSPTRCLLGAGQGRAEAMQSEHLDGARR